MDPELATPAARGDATARAGQWQNSGPRRVSVPDSVPASAPPTAADAARPSLGIESRSEPVNGVHFTGVSHSASHPTSHASHSPHCPTSHAFQHAAPQVISTPNPSHSSAHHAPQSQATPSGNPDIDSLLYGLDADDFFDDLDEFSDEPVGLEVGRSHVGSGGTSGQVKQAGQGVSGTGQTSLGQRQNTAQLASVTFKQAASHAMEIDAPQTSGNCGSSHLSDYNNDDSPDQYATPDHDPFFAPMPANIPAMVSFSTGRGKQLARPSAAAMARAQKLVREAEHAAEVEDSADGQPKAEQSGLGAAQNQAKLENENQPANVSRQLEGQMSTGMSGQPSTWHNPDPLDRFEHERATKRRRTDELEQRPLNSAPVSPNAPSRSREVSPRIRAVTSPLRSSAQAWSPGARHTPRGVPEWSSSRSGQISASAPPKGNLERAMSIFGEEDAMSTPHRTGFALGSGRAAPSVKPESMARAMAILGSVEDTPSQTEQASLENPGRRAVGNGTSHFCSPTKASPRLGTVAFPHPGPADGLRSPTKMSPGLATPGFQSASGRPAPALDPAARARAMALFGEEDTPSRSTHVQGDRSPATFGPAYEDAHDDTPSRSEFMGRDASSFHLDSPTRPAAGGYPASLSRPRGFAETRAPLQHVLPNAARPGPLRQSHGFESLVDANDKGKARAGTGTGAPSQVENVIPSTPAVRTPSIRRPVSIRTPGMTPGNTPRRIGLGTTPLRTSAIAGGSKRRPFSTPFKNPLATSATTPFRSPAVPNVVPRATLAPTMRIRAEQPKVEIPREDMVFDLSPPPGRVSMRDAGLCPGMHSAAALRRMGLPDEIWQINCSNASYYQFLGANDIPLGTVQACEHLLREMCSLATQKWVDNHWCLILWKLAGQVIAKPDLFAEKWNWDEVLRQLKYRYEREFCAAQRPIVRRIQEHDSSPSLPMVLCVSAIVHQEPIEDEKGKPVPQRPLLQLTDGWYHIRAPVDECLGRAVRKGKIQVGRKLGVSGAKLDSAADGREVLEALNKSHLVISGNSTHLVAWDAQLGVCREPFVAGLSSLSVDGGLIPLMSVVLERVYPLGFANANRNGDNMDAKWNEEEEREKAEEWRQKYEAESSRLEEKYKKKLERLEDLTAHLCSYAEDVRSSSTPPDDVSTEFEALLASRDLVSSLRAVPTSHIVHLAQHARTQLEFEMADKRAEFDSALRASCPPREVRNFRLVRFSDTRQGRKEAARTGMLNIANAASLGAELVEGRRYLVTNIVPCRQGDWSKPKPGAGVEVYLYTRADTRWQAVAS